MSRRAQLNRIERLITQLEPQVRDAFLAAVISGRDAVDMRALEAALQAGNIARAVELMTLPQGVLFPLDQALVGAFAAGGATVTESARRAGVVFGFDGRHPRAEAWVRDHVGTLITNIARSQREATTMAVRNVIEQQLVAGVAPRTAALDIVGRVDRATGQRVGVILGLDVPRADRLLTVSNAMRTPEGVQSIVVQSRDTGALSVKYKVNAATRLRILRAYRAGTAVPEAERIISLKQYGNQILLERGETISRTEAITALRAGRAEAFEQAIDQGLVEREKLVKVWSATMDDRTREDHQAMNGVSVREGELFTLLDGSQMEYPGDTSHGAPAEQVINCRCYTSYQVEWIKQNG